MKFLDNLKNYFATKEAPYNWGASIEHLRATQCSQNHLFGTHIKELMLQLEEKTKRMNQFIETYESQFNALQSILVNQDKKIKDLEKNLKAKPKKKVAK